MTEIRRSPQGPTLVRPQQAGSPDSVKVPHKFPAYAEFARMGKAPVREQASAQPAQPQIPADQARLQEIQQRLAQIREEYGASLIDIGPAPMHQEKRDKGDLHKLSLLERLNPFIRTTTADVIDVYDQEDKLVRIVDRHRWRLLFWQKNTQPGVYAEYKEPNENGKMQQVRERIGEHVDRRYVVDPQNPGEFPRSSYFVTTEETNILNEEAKRLSTEIRQMQQGKWRPQSEIDAENKRIEQNQAMDAKRQQEMRELFRNPAIAQELAARRMQYIEPGMPHALTKLTRSEKREVRREALQNIFIPFGFNRFFADRLQQIGLSGLAAIFGSAALAHFPASELQAGLALGSSVVGTGMRADIRRDQFLQIEQDIWDRYELFQKSHPHLVTEEAQVQYANELYLERNWVRAERLRGKNPDLTEDMVLAKLKAGDSRMRLADPIINGEASPALFVATLLAGWKGVDTAIVTHGWDTLMSLWAYIVSASFVPKSLRGAFNFRSNIREARKIVELRKEKRQKIEAQN